VLPTHTKYMTCSGIWYHNDYRHSFLLENSITELKTKARTHKETPAFFNHEQQDRVTALLES